VQVQARDRPLQSRGLRLRHTGAAAERGPLTNKRGKRQILRQSRVFVLAGPLSGNTAREARSLRARQRRLRSNLHASPPRALAGEYPSIPHPRTPDLNAGRPQMTDRFPTRCGFLLNVYAEIL